MSSAEPIAPTLSNALRSSRKIEDGYFVTLLDGAVVKRRRIFYDQTFRYGGVWVRAFRYENEGGWDTIAWCRGPVEEPVIEGKPNPMFSHEPHTVPSDDATKRARISVRRIKEAFIGYWGIVQPAKIVWHTVNLAGLPPIAPSETDLLMSGALPK
jgi:hypothetical protein